MNDVVIIDNGGANIASLQFALSRLGASSTVSADAATIKKARRLILPGVGAAADAMTRLRQRGLDGVIPTLRQPLLGICLGMQLLFETSAEGGATCLGIICGRARRLTAAKGRPVPHMGWNTLKSLARSPLLEGLKAGDYAYFVHSYALPVEEVTIADCDYGGSFAACVQWKNYYGVQFHPERSASVGARLLRNFLEIY